MKKNPESHFIPHLTTEAGRCLTVANWQEVGVNRAAYDLTSLLMKPGFDLLSTLPDLGAYSGWTGKVVLNASMPEIDREGGYTLRSEYDGSRKRYTSDDILMLIVQLKPQMVLLPEGIQPDPRSFPETIMPFFAPGNLPTHFARDYGVYFLYDIATPFASLVKQIQKYPSFPLYAGGDLSVAMMQELADLGVQYIASDVPARDACLGKLYCQEGVISLTNEEHRLDFSVIDEQCTCPTCKQKFTRAYLHHLLEHTPLLCQRFLIQHNVSFAHLRQP